MPYTSFSNYKTSLKKLGITRLIMTAFGMLLMAAGAGAGVVLVMQPQLFNQQAHVLNYEKPCSGGAVASGKYFCQNGITCLQCVNGTNIPADRKYCPKPCYYEAPVNLTNPCYKSQVDPSYSQTVISGCPFHQNGCSQAVFATLLCDKKGVDMNPVDVANTYYPNVSLCLGAPSQSQLNALKAAGIPYRGIPKEKFTTGYIKNYLRSGKKVMMLCKVNGEDHWTLANSITSEGEIVLSDPKYGDGNILGNTLKIDLKECMDMLEI